MNSIEEKAKRNAYMKEYYKTYKNTPEFKSYMERTRADRLEKARIRGRKYYREHKEQVINASNEYYRKLASTESGRRFLREQRKRFKKTAAGIESEKRYLSGPSGKENSRKSCAKYARSENGKLSCAIRHNLRRAAKLSVERTLTPTEWREVLESYNGFCVYCNKKSDKLQQDHIVPLSKGGGHSKENVVPACPSCNSSKSNRPMLVWMLEKHKEKNYVTTL